LDGTGAVPLHNVTHSCYFIQGFQLVFEYGIRYYPNKKGISLLFQQENNEHVTPFQVASESYGRDKVMRVVEETLIRYSSSSDNSPQLNVADAILTAAIDEHIHLDYVYFLFCRHPDVLVKLLSWSIDDSNNSNNNNDSNDDNDDDCTSDENSDYDDYSGNDIGTLSDNAENDNNEKNIVNQNDNHDGSIINRVG
jgi:hypothetical protein